MRLSVFFLLFIVLSGCTSTPPPEEVPVTPAPVPLGPVVEVGDLVWIDFTGMIQDTGEVFDTTIKDVAEDSGQTKFADFPVQMLEHPKDYSEPIGVFPGSGIMPIPIEKALVGMREGEEMTVLVTPTDGYGYRSDEYLVTIPRTITIPLEEEYPVSGSSTLPSVGEVVKTNPYFDAKVIEVTNSTIKILNMPGDIKEVEIPYPADVAVGEENIVLTLRAVEGGDIEYSTQGGNLKGKVLKVDDTSVTADFNHVLSDKTLSVFMKVDTIVKREDYLGQAISFESYEAGLEKAKAEDKLIVMDLYAYWCHFCQRLEDETFPDPRITEFRDDFVWIKEEVSGEGNRTDLAEKYDVEGFPLLVFMDSEGNVLEKENRFMTPYELREKLRSLQ